MRRLTVPELRLYVAALRRMRDRDEPTEEDGPILARVQELDEEVRDEY